MKTVEELKVLPVWVEPNHLISTAKILLKGHGVKALGVVDEGNLLGVVTPESLAVHEDSEPVSKAMVASKLVIDAGFSVRQAAEAFLAEDVDFAPSIKDGAFLGIVTSTMLLRELNRSWDPLTNLSWQDLLREWGVDNLKRGREVTIIFIDLDDFGQYNKRYGHTVGDQVLRAIAQMLDECIDSEKDVLVRYGGDEFAIGSVRDRIEAEMLAEMIKRRVNDVFVKDSAEPVTFCVGIFGGKRTKERENDHYQSTLDNLINLASKDCLANKARKDLAAAKVLAPAMAVAASHEAAPATEPVRSAMKAAASDVRLVDVLADDQSPNSMTTVILSVGEGIASGVSARMGGSTLQSVASATAKAVERAFTGSQLRIEDLHLGESPVGQRVATVSGHLTDTKGTRPVIGAVAVGENLYWSVAEATLEAFFN